MLVAVELVVVVVGDRREPRLVLGGEHRHRVAAEVGAGHRDDVHVGVRSSPTRSSAPSRLFSVGGDVVELVDREHACR